MRVVLIHVKENYTPVPPTGLLYVGTVLKQAGHDVRVFDVNYREKDTVIDEVKAFDPHVVGFTAMTTSYTVTKQFNEALRQKVPRAFYCWGGVHATALPQDTIRDNTLDFLVYGEGEYTMLEVCERIGEARAGKKSRGADLSGVKGTYYVKGGKVLKNPPRPLIKDLDSVPIPDRSLLGDFTWYLSPPGILRGKFYWGITTMYTSRGCPYQCIFCASKAVHGGKIRRRSVENVIEEMRYLRDEFQVKGIYFNDDTFATDERWLRQFCEQVKEHCPDMIWGCQTRASIAQDISILKVMADGGCVQVDIGAESGSDKILENLKKGITADMIAKSFRNLREVGMETFATFILGNPGETLEDVEKTRELAKLAPGGVSFLILVPYPGSPLYDMAKKEGWFLDENVVFDDRWTNKQSDKPIMQASIPVDELIRLRADLQNSFFLKNNLQTILAFARSPYFLARAALTVLGHPIHTASSAASALKKRKAMDFLEDMYQKFNEDLRR